jgi:AraC-like DNA-binding protein
MKRSVDLPMNIRPVVAMADEYEAGYMDPVHTHPRAQLSLSGPGVVSFTIGDSNFLQPSNRAIWIPAGIPHAVRFRDKVTGHTVYIDPAHARSLTKVKIFAVSPLMRALVEEVTTFSHDYDIDGREGRIVQLLLEEIQRAPEATMMVPLPRNPRLRRVCEKILHDPSCSEGLDYWASSAGMGRRTFTRTFKEELGMSLLTWRQQVKVMEAVSLLSEGQSITAVAYQVGYDSPSAFTAMFHRTVGEPPSIYHGHR